MTKEEQSNQLNLTIVALVALVAIVGLVALVMNAANSNDVTIAQKTISTSNPASQPIDDSNVRGQAAQTMKLRGGGGG